ncbi:MAG: DivIVA family protein [Lachnospiraceae bacterium]|jgi:cell division initiation protein|nr:DivIVA family protein [Lachnospiraceae bacterium]
MITPIELQSKTFKTGIGYEKRDVENFLNSLLSDYEMMYKENMELKDKINTLNNGLSYYKTIEKTLQKALVLAEKAAEDTKEAAIKEARALEDEAKGKAQVILADAQYELQQLHDKTIQLMRQYDSYKAQFKHLAAAQIELLESDSFKIQIANLDAFARNNITENDSAYSEAAATESEEAIPDEDFEFDVNENEQEL